MVRYSCQYFIDNFMSFSLQTFLYSFSASGNFKNFIRLTFSYVEEEEIDEGIRKIATALKTINEKTPTK